MAQKKYPIVRSEKLHVRELLDIHMREGSLNLTFNSIQNFLKNGI